jgi:hypothetical protein
MLFTGAANIPGLLPKEALSKKIHFFEPREERIEVYFKRIQLIGPSTYRLDRKYRTAESFNYIDMFVQWVLIH